MTSKSAWAVPCIVVALVVALLCCLCLVAATGVSVLYIYSWTQTAPPGLYATPTPTPSEPPIAASPTQPVITGPIPTPTALPPDVSHATPVSPLAIESRDLLAQAYVPEADEVLLAERLQGLHDVPRVLATSATPIPVGTVEAFWVYNDDTTEYSQVQAEMVYASPHVYFWVALDVDYDLSDVRALVDEFESRIYPTDREFFGSEWTPGIDGDPHLHILFTRGLGSWVAGYYGSNDEYVPEISEYSNGHEMFYVSADGQSLADEYTLSTLAHEFAHMIQWNLDPNEEGWLDEGFADLASFLNGYNVGGWDYAYAAAPDIPLTFWPSGEDSNLHYGQSFLFMEYFLERFGEEASRALASHQGNGLDSVDQTTADLGLRDPLTGQLILADELFRDFAVTLLLQDSTVGDGRYTMPSYPGAPIMSAKDRWADCPLDLPSSTVSQFGIDALGIDCLGGGDPATDWRVVFDGATMAQVVPTEPHSGEWAFWSNRGNVSDMTFSRSFDLTGATGPIELSYWTWFDIEEGWDYTYLEISEDAGQTWTILTTPSGTDYDPAGSAYGWGYTGFSGGGTSGVWVEETIDLSDYAGQGIQLRFEYVTDLSVNGEGFLVDDISIPAIGYTEDFEEGDGGWAAEGFVRLYNRVPQTYRLVLVRTGPSSTSVTEILLDDNQHGEFGPLGLGGEFDRATLLVIGTARYTWQPAPYHIQVYTPSG